MKGFAYLGRVEAGGDPLCALLIVRVVVEAGAGDVAGANSVLAGVEIVAVAHAGSGVGRGDDREQDQGAHGELRKRPPREGRASQHWSVSGHVADAVGMKPGHKHKFKSWFGRAR